MNRLFLITVITVLTFFAHQQVTLAVCTEGPPNNFTCDTNPPNPDPTGVQQETNMNNLTVTVLPGAGIDTIPANGGNDGTAIQTDNGNDKITVTNANLSGEGGINTTRGNDEINVTGSTILATNGRGIFAGNDNDIVNVADTEITSTSDALDSGDDDDTVNVTRTTLFSSNNDALESGGGSDIVTISYSKITSTGNEAIDLFSRDDILTLGNEVILESLVEQIDCGNGFDTIVFAMDVPEEAVGLISSQILSAGLPDGSITINGLFYDWNNCELLVPQLNGVRVIRPIPTLSEWGLIAMAGILGLIGFIAIRKKYSTA